MIIGSRRFGFLHIGRYSFETLANTREIAIVLWPRKNAPEWELGWHFYLRLKWRWPVVRYHKIYASGWDGISSADWTGRDLAIEAIEWPSHMRPRFEFTRIP